MTVRSANSSDGQKPGRPSPPPPRWHLRTQVSRKTLFDLIQDTLPPGGLRVSGADEGGGATAEADELSDTAAFGPPVSARGVVPQSYLDSLASTIPMPLNPASSWNDGDTAPDLPQHFRPITITLASQPVLSSGLPALRAPHPLHAAAKRAAWMLSGVALTFLIGAAAFGGRPLFQAMGSVLSRSRAQAATPPAPASTTPAKATPARGADDAARRTLVATAGPTVVQIHTGSVGGAALDAEVETGRVDEEDALPRKSDAVPARARRPRRSRAPAANGDPDSSMADDAVLPLDLAPVTPRSAPARTAPAVAKTRALRQIDFEDPFGGP